MTEVMTRPLRLVPTPTEVPLIHPLLEGATPRPSSHTLDDGTTRHMLYFATQIEGSDVTQLLAEPLNDLVSGTTHDVYQGLRAQVYPNGRVGRYAQRLGRDAVMTGRAMRRDIAGLAEVVSKDTTHRMVPATVHVYRPEVAMFEVEDRLMTTHPLKIKRLCDRAGVTVADTLWDVYRRDRGDVEVSWGHKTPLGVVIRTQPLRDFMLHATYAKKTVVDTRGFEDALIRRDELPSGAWVDTMDFVERIKLLPPLNDEVLASRWRVYLRRDNVPRHVARALINWESGPHGTRMRYDATASYYDKKGHQIIHSSPLLGAIMLAQSLDPKTLGTAFNTLIGRNQYKPWSHREVPRMFAGALPSLLASAGVESALKKCDLFAALQTV